MMIYDIWFLIGWLRIILSLCFFFFYHHNTSQQPYIKPASTPPCQHVSPLPGCFTKITYTAKKTKFINKRFNCWPGSAFEGCPCLRGVRDVLYTAEPARDRQGKTKLKEIRHCLYCVGRQRINFKSPFWSHLYLTGRPPHWTASKGRWSGSGIWWRWLCGPPGARWRSGHLGSGGRRRAWRSQGRPPSLILTGSNSWPVWTSSPLGWTCCCSEPVEVDAADAWVTVGRKHFITNRVFSWRMSCKKNENSVIVVSTPGHWKVRWGFVIHKTFLELRNETALQHSPGVDADWKTAEKKT